MLVRYEYVVPYSFVASVKSPYFVFDAWSGGDYDSSLTVVGVCLVDRRFLCS